MSKSKLDLIHDLTPILVSKNFEGDTLGYLYFQADGKGNKKTATLNSQTITEIQDLAKSGTFTAAAKSCYFIRASYIEKTNILVAGLGTKKNFSPEKARQTGSIVYGKVSAEKVKSFGFDIDTILKSVSRSQAEPLIQAFLEGFYLTSYAFNKYKSGPKIAPTLKEVHLVTKDSKNAKWLGDLITRTLITVDCVFITRDYSNEPSNYGTPEYYAKDISALAKRFGLKCKVMGEAECKKEKMGLFLAVSAGSDREAKCVILEYTPKTAKKGKLISLVGKGVTFDSGGISIKPSMRMEDMKHDMTGAATMLGSTLLAARLGSKNRLVTILVFTENMPNGIATQPGNVITGRSGKTVEIINTDAEGRLILADALDLAQDYKPDIVVNSATLTGACSIALGKLASALFSNDNGLAKRVFAASEATEETLWELPMFDEYFEDMKSNYADMMNSANDGYGGTIRGAIFMKQFIRPGTKWAHIDLANRAYDQGYLPYAPRKGSSGIYVRTFAQLAMDY
ncbi:MAG: leucyl aminopeptidase [Bdellovibrionales bacterium]|nr:leucyl aminopeptidase [Bdellovibrionales bacterium]